LTIRGGRRDARIENKGDPVGNSDLEARTVAVRGEVLKVLASCLRCSADALDRSERFRNLGLDSSGAVALARDLERALKRPLSPTLLWDYPTVDDLTTYLAGEASEPPAEARPNTHSPSRAVNEPIAIVGASCRLPAGIDSTDRYWDALRDELDAVVDGSRARWDADAFYDPQRAAAGKTVTRSAGLVEGVDLFDAPFFGISAEEAAQMDPQQRIMLELAWHALEDAHVRPDALRKTSTGVFIGAMGSDYARAAMEDVREINAHTATGGDTSIISARISYVLGLEGPSMTVNTACSSSLVAVHLACQNLRLGECDLALAGGVHVMTGPHSTIAMSKFGGLGPGGRCRAFGAGADGYVRGEGGGVVVLKPLSRALADGDRIYCTILGGAVNNDGFSNGLTAPNPRAQEAVLRKAYAASGRAPTKVHYVETHGTGTPLGDPIEARALAAVLTRDRSASRPLIIGSAKSNIGHLEAAAGVAGLIKLALSLSRHAIPPTLHYDAPNPRIPFTDLKLEVATKYRPWPFPSEEPLAGISSFGFGGTNCHLVVSGGPTSRAHLVTVGALTAEALVEDVETLRDRASRAVSSSDVVVLGHAAASMGPPFRAAFVSSSPAELESKAATFLRKPAPSTVEKRPRVAFVFPGHGQQWSGMGRQLLHTEPVFRRALVACDDAIRRCSGRHVIEELLRDGDEAALDEVELAQQVLFSFDVALAELWRSWGVEPDVVLGHSLGEVAAAVIAGILDIEQAARLVCVRSRLLNKVPAGGAMLAVDLPASDAAELAAGFENRVVVGAENSAHSTVLSGERASLGAIAASLTSRGVAHGWVRIGFASHSPHVDGIRDEFLDALNSLKPQAARIPMVSTVTSSWLRGEECGAEYWWANLREPVKFRRAVEMLSDERELAVIEVSAHPILARPLRSVLEQGPARRLVLPSLVRHEDERRSMLESAASLFEAGADIDPARVSGVFPDARDPTLLVLSAKSDEALAVQAATFARSLEEEPSISPWNVAVTKAKHRAHFRHRMAVVGSTSADLGAKLRAIAGGEERSRIIRGRVEPGGRPSVAFAFVGDHIDAKSVESLETTQPVFRDALTFCAGLVGRSLEQPLKQLLFSGEGIPDESEYATSALFCVHYAFCELWRSWGIKPAAVMGRGVGEIVAAAVADMISLEDGVRLAVERGGVLRSARSGDAPSWSKDLTRTGEAVVLRLPTTKLVSSVTGALVDGTELSPSSWMLGQGGTEPAAFRAGLKTLEQEGIAVFLEIGGGSVAFGMTAAPERHERTVDPSTAATEDLLDVVGQLYVRGVEVDWTRFFARRAYRRVSVPLYPFRGTRYWIRGMGT
jgi:acyl transferase domain-containing protein/acyl carrier protein